MADEAAADGAPAPPALDPVAVIRSRPYLSALVLAAILGIPISAVAYGFLALVSEDPGAPVRRPAGRPLRRRDAGVVAGALAGALRAADRADHPLPARQRRPLTGLRVPRPAGSAGRPGAARASSWPRWPR